MDTTKEKIVKFH